MTEKKPDPDMEFAAGAICMVMKMLREYYTDTQIKVMFTRKKVNGMLLILNESKQ